MTSAQIRYLNLCYRQLVDKEVEAQAEREDYSKINGYYFPKFQEVCKLMTEGELTEVEQAAEDIFEGK